MDPIEVEQPINQKAEANTGINFISANAAIALDAESESKHHLKSYESGRAFSKATDGKSGTDAILWDLGKNTIKEILVPDTFRVAILIQRKN